MTAVYVSRGRRIDFGAGQSPSSSSSWSSLDEDFLDELAFAEEKCAERCHQKEDNTQLQPPAFLPKEETEIDPLSFDKIVVHPIGAEEYKSETTIFSHALSENEEEEVFSRFGSGIAQALIGGDLYLEESSDGENEDGEALTIYLPNRVHIQLRIHHETSVGLAIVICLKKVASLLSRGEDLGRGAESLGRGSEAAEYYDLLLHDTDGEPDDDCPALERSRPVLAFGTDELCLVEKPEAPAIKPDDRGADSTALHSLNTAKSHSRCIRVYFPDRSQTSVQIQAGMNAKAIANLALNQSHGYRHVSTFEIRLHDTEGLPDTDLPALDPNQSDLGDLDEICLVFNAERQENQADQRHISRPSLRRGSNSTNSLRRRRSSFFLSTGDSASSLPQPSSARSPSESSQQHRRATINSINVQFKIKVHCLEDDDILEVKADASWTMVEIRKLVLRRKKMHNWPIDYGLRMSEADRERLALQEVNVDDHLTMADLRMSNIYSLELYNREWQYGNYWIDAKPVPDPSIITDCKKKKIDRTAPPPETAKTHITPADFHFNPVTGPVYEQWDVVKINEFGRRQDRILGIDGLNLYNTKRESKHKTFKAIASTYRPSRRISDILKTSILEINGNRNTIQIVYLENNKNVSRKYELDSDYEAAQVVAKIRYNRRLLADAARP